MKPKILVWMRHSEVEWPLDTLPPLDMVVVVPIPSKRKRPEHERARVSGYVWLPAEHRIFVETKAINTPDELDLELD